MENEHLNNCGNFRAVRDISLKPVNVGGKDELTIEQMMDDDHGPLPKRRLANLLITVNTKDLKNDYTAVNTEQLFHSDGKHAETEVAVLHRNNGLGTEEAHLLHNNHNYAPEENGPTEKAIDVRLESDVLIHCPGGTEEHDNSSVHDHPLPEGEEDKGSHKCQEKDDTNGTEIIVSVDSAETAL